MRRPEARVVAPEAGVTTALVVIAVINGVAVICHGPWTLVEAGVLGGRTITSWPSVRTDIENAGGTWRDEAVVVCEEGPNTLVSSRKPDDLPLFTERFVEVFAR